MALTKITTSVVAVNSLTAANIADNSIDATKIANNQILARHIAADALSDQIADNSITAGMIPNATALTLDGGVTIDNITIDGTEIDLSSGDLTIDVAGDINLDAGGGDFNFKDDGTTIGFLANSSSDLWIGPGVADKDLIFRGNDSDGGGAFTALTLDMSDAGSAYFNNKVGIGTTSPAYDLHVEASGGIAGLISRSGSGTNSFENAMIIDAKTGNDAADGFGPALYFTFTDSGVTRSEIANISVIRAGADNSGQMQFGVRNAGTWDYDAMIIDKAGHLLVGKTSGTSGNKLETDGRISAGAGSNSQPTFNCEGDTNTGINLPETDRIQFITGGTERIRVAADGNVGIGNSNPQHPFVVHLTDGEIAMFGSNGMNSPGNYAGIGLGQVLANNTTYQKVSLVTEGRDSGSYVQDFHILVDTAADSNSAVLSDAKLTIDGGTGAITMPSQPCFSVALPAATTSGSVVVWGGEHLDIGNNYNTSNGRFTAPIAGNYYFTFWILMDPSGASDYSRVIFSKNGTSSTQYGDNLESTDAGAQADYHSVGLSAVIPLAANDYIEVYNSGENPTYGTAYGNFSGFLVS